MENSWRIWYIHKDFRYNVFSLNYHNEFIGTYNKSIKYTKPLENIIIFNS